ncbi:MAG: AraC family transcriptional regulator [Nibricoccus sp.]
MPIRHVPEFFRETHIVGRKCREHMLDSDHVPILRNARFIWVGHSIVRNPYRMVRLRSVHSHVVASIAGRGRTLIDGKAVDWRPGQVLLAPVGAHHAFEVDGSGPWNIAWVFFDDHVSAPALKGREPQLVTADAGDFVTILKMLTREAANAAKPAVLEALVTLLDATVRRLAGVESVDQRLSRLWNKVEADLAREWSVAELAKHACMSEEHLRRLCHQYCQRSPFEQLTHLRLQRASTMLRSSPVKLDEVAQAVGYASVYSFSVAFRRWSGVPPARFRRGEVQVS